MSIFRYYNEGPSRCLRTQMRSSLRYFAVHMKTELWLGLYPHVSLEMLLASYMVTEQHAAKNVRYKMCTAGSSQSLFTTEPISQAVSVPHYF
jgi:hypothetical protein